MNEVLSPQGVNKRERLGSSIHIVNTPPVRPLDLLGGAEAILAGELYKQVQKKMPDESPEGVRKEFYKTITEASHKLDPNTLRWQTLRQNAVGSEQARLTGFEGYYAGSRLTPEEIVQDITSTGDEVLRVLPSGLRKEVARTLTGEQPTFPAILWLSDTFGAMLGRYRAMRSHNKEAQRFRDSLAVLPSTKISYIDGGKRDFIVPVLTDNEVLRAYQTNIESDPLHPYTLMEHIGKVGDSLVRTVTGSLDPTEINQLRYKPTYW